MGSSEVVADVAVVGGGHNGLVCAAYLARAGLDVVVVEQNERCGGALFSSTVDGVTLEHGGVEHTTIVASDIVSELDLAGHGLEYRYRTVGALHRFGDGVQLLIAETVDETAASIAELDVDDAEAWRSLADEATRMMALLGAVSSGRPPTMATLRRAAWLLGAADRALLDLATSSVLDLAASRFADPHVRAMAISRAGFSGLPAWAPGTGAVFALTPAGHGRRYGRPVGGSSALVDALERCATAAGVRIITATSVRSLQRDDQRWTLTTTGAVGRVQATRVVSAIPPQVTMLELVPRPMVPRRLRRRLAGIEVNVGNLSQFTLASRLVRPPDLGVLGRHVDAAASMLWLLAAPEDATASHGAAAVGALAPRPSLVATFPSLTDPSSADGSAASLWINGFLARRLAGGREWTSADEAVAAERIWATMQACLPGVRDLVDHEVFTSPGSLAARTGAEDPGSHVAGTLGQLLGARPARGMARHRSGIEGLYLTGAGTNPGPSISGLPGRACARALLDDLGVDGPAGRIRRLADELGIEVRRARSLLELTRSG
ncbi:MAG: NAD(P)/FAD-dependent oxidoreductase [Actinomycetota bacterium]